MDKEAVAEGSHGAGAFVRRLALRLPLYVAALVLAWGATTLLLYRPITTGGETVMLLEPMELIGHAGAGIPQGTYTNSLEAFDAAAARGLTLIEADFATTSDGGIVLTHDWGPAYLELRPGLSPMPPAFANWLPAKASSRDEFLDAPMREGLTPLDADGLVEWLLHNPGLRIVTDVKDDNAAVLAALAARTDIGQDRFVPQIYHQAELEQVRALGFDAVIYTLYREADTDLGQVIAFARANGLTVTMPDTWASEGTVRVFAQAGVPLYLHTINDPARAGQLADWGATGVYTDFLVLASAGSDL